MSAAIPTPRARRLQVIGAHAADFVWRAAGAIGLTTAGGGSASVLAAGCVRRRAALDRYVQPAR
jgi:4-oxalomesaconate hydratase